MQTVVAPESDTLQIGEFAKLGGTNLRTLRYYEELGLLLPAERSDGGFRRYQRYQLDRLATIQRLQDLGLSLKEIAEALATEGDERPQTVIARLQPAVNRQIELTEARIAQLSTELQELQQARFRLLNVCQHCEHDITLDHCDPCPRDQVSLSSMIRALLT